MPVTNDCAFHRAPARASSYEPASNTDSGPAPFNGGVGETIDGGPVTAPARAAAGTKSAITRDDGSLGARHLESRSKRP
jgi:hypothetical protein